MSTEIRKLVRTIAAANVLWGAPRIHGELLKLGFEISERTVCASPKWVRSVVTDTCAWRIPNFGANEPSEIELL